MNKDEFDQFAHVPPWSQFQERYVREGQEAVHVSDEVGEYIYENNPWGAPEWEGMARRSRDDMRLARLLVQEAQLEFRLEIPGYDHDAIRRDLAKTREQITSLEQELDDTGHE